MEKNAPSKLALGFALLSLGAMMAISMRTKVVNEKPVVSVSFASEPVVFERSGISNKVEDKDISSGLPVRIIIPRLSVSLEVKEAKIVEGYWEVFENTAAWGEQSGLPGESGNQVIFAHAREGLFLPLIDISVDDAVFVLTHDIWYEYRVTEIKEVFPDQVEVVAPTETETLTLYTCSGYNDSKRLIVTAAPVAT